MVSRGGTRTRAPLLKRTCRTKNQYATMGHVVLKYLTTSSGNVWVRVKLYSTVCAWGGQGRPQRARPKTLTECNLKKAIDFHRREAETSCSIMDEPGRCGISYEDGETARFRATSNGGGK